MIFYRFAKTAHLHSVADVIQAGTANLPIAPPRKTTDELTEEDKASLEYLLLHTTPCPTCAAPAQKTHGCNHMICFKCHSHFCYLCSAWLSPANPYKHYNEETTGCYMRLWELEGGDGDDVGIGFAGGIQQIPQEPQAVADVELREHIPEAPREEMQDLIRVDILDENHVLVDLDNHPALPPQELQREGPLVLRINQLPPPPAPPVPDAPQARRNRRQGGGRGLQNRPIDLRPAGIRAAAPMGGRRIRGPAARGDGRPVGEQAREAEFDQDWVDRFVQMALNDEEDLMDDGDDENDAAWEIPVR